MSAPSIVTVALLPVTSALTLFTVTFLTTALSNARPVVVTLTALTLPFSSTTLTLTLLLF